jgi:phosphatidylglycerol:prolipoprotein diacylglycerol transferase
VIILLPILSIGPVTLPLPPLLLIIGFWLGTILSDLFAKKTDIDPKNIDNLIWYSLISGVIGARIAFITRNPAAFKGNLISIVSINPNLFDHVSGILVAVSVGFVFVSKNKFSGWKILDILTPFFIVLFMSTNLSMFASGDGFGITTSMPWGIKLWGELRHPVQLYFALAGFLILSVIFFNSSALLTKPGRLFLLFSIMESSSFLFLSAFQENTEMIIFGLHLKQIIYWLILLVILIILWQHTKSVQLEDTDES